MDGINLALAIVGGVLSFLTCRPDFTPEGVAGATACAVVHDIVADHSDTEQVKQMPPEESPRDDANP